MQGDKKPKRRVGLTKFVRRVKSLLVQRRFWYITGGVLAGVIVLQLIFPYDRAFFLARVDQLSVGLQTRDEIARNLEQIYNNASVVTVNPDTTASFTEAGITPDNTATADRVVSYPLWQRAIPFSFVYKLFTHNNSSEVTYQELPLSQWAKRVSEECFEPAKDASIVVTGESGLAVLPSSSGWQCKENELIDNLRATALSAPLQVDSKRSELAPKRSDQQVSAQLDKLEAAIQNGLVVTVLGIETRAEATDIVNWLVFKDGQDGELIPDVDPQMVQSFIDQVQSPVYIAPGTTIVTVRDGQETGRAVGASGRGIDSEALLASIRERLSEPKNEPIEAVVSVLPPREEVRRSYSNSTAGLQALLGDLTREKGNMAIAVTELGGQWRSASSNGTKQYHPASTYKLFVAYSVIKRIESDQLKWTDQINGKSVEECMATMIIDSDNACPESFAEKFSWGAIQSELRGLGMSGTDLNRTEPVSTVADQALFLQKLYDNQLMKPENKDKLLGWMRQQRFRAGIPAGVSHTVADKVGFLSGLLHDSAIVYAPGRTYIIVVYSDGGTWGNIADVARRVDALIGG